MYLPTQLAKRHENKRDSQRTSPKSPPRPKTSNLNALLGVGEEKEKLLKNLSLNMGEKGARDTGGVGRKQKGKREPRFQTQSKGGGYVGEKVRQLSLTTNAPGNLSKIIHLAGTGVQKKKGKKGLQEKKGDFNTHPLKAGELQGLKSAIKKGAVFSSRGGQGGKRGKKKPPRKKKSPPLLR